MNSKIPYLICFLYANIFILEIYGQNTYKAAVVEFTPKLTADTPKNRVLENVEDYLNYIEDAADQHVDIILFPEYGLTGANIDPRDLSEVSTEVPNPDDSISPCTNSANYSKALIDLSCAAATNAMYVVINIFERVSKSNIFHNTNVIFNRGGTVVARYRKMNLYNESYVAPGNVTATFKTDFGVTFGVIICNDILFGNSSLSVLRDEHVTDILYSAAWATLLPFFGGASVQQGYARANGVNLLASGYNNPTSSLGGSGIYLANGTIADIHVSGAKLSKMLITDVPVLSQRLSPDTCQKAVNFTEEKSTHFGIESMIDINKFRTLKEDLSDYTFKTLNLNQTAIYEFACSGEGSCCYINVTLNKPIANSNYVYKLAVFNGGKHVLKESIGVRACSLVACLNESSSSCGERSNDPPNGVVFETIFVKGNFKNIRNAQDSPTTLNHNLQPIHNFVFCRKAINESRVVATIATTNQTNLLTFGIFGRVFDNDNKGTGVFNSGSFHLTTPVIVFTISIVIFLLQE
ncbi:vanin-like protein 2 [Photinus pyralis]|uniref:vanin-like protein 2 n=1 Tax=Photinus pyralis TaxID=7054 RepID=UPI001267015F|nr:vanin-like protein 2 [Photinus pyralis]XP_031334121.1 vanin-like protein 2 [Photinus pyralis]